MSLVTTINRYNGNLFLSSSVDSSCVLIEIDSYSHTLAYEYSSWVVTGLCVRSSSLYYLCFGNQWIGTYDNGVITYQAIDSGLTSVDKMLYSRDGNLYLLNKDTNELVKYGYWTYTLPSYSRRSYGDILLRESDGVVIYSNGVDLQLILDEGSQATLFGARTFGAGEMGVGITGEWRAEHITVSAEAVETIYYESSSSSSSNLSMSSSSSSGDSSSSSSSSSVDSSSSSSSSSVDSSSSSSSSSSSTEGILVT